MSEGEILVEVACGFFASAGWIWWFATMAMVKTPRHTGTERIWLGFAPVVSLGLLLFVLRNYAAHDVRDDIRYLWMYGLMGAAWALLAGLLARFLGFDVRGDVLERGNEAAAAAMFGVVVGSTLAFAGGNIGDGPGWWVVVFSGILSTGTLFAIWVLLDRMLALTDVITIDRDEAAGLRAAGYWIAGGLILGRAVAGDWHSAERTVSDFCRSAWPVLILAGSYAVVERASRPKPEIPVRNVVRRGWCPALGYIALGLISVWMQGSWK